MTYKSVVVHDVDKLESFGKKLGTKKGELKKLTDQVTALCREQERNWEDERYKTLSEKLESFAKSSIGLQKELEDAEKYISVLTRELHKL